ncbi:MAG: VUT family protein [Coriobacteriia bacterium]|nr:VUT family protein [Coriobacteriia bacterium]
MLKETLEDYKILLRSIPASTITVFVVSVILMNLLANKELVSFPYLALDCGFTLSWVAFLCQDMICKRFGPKASVKVSIMALACNLAVSLLFWLVSLAPGMWGAYYTTESLEVNAALNSTIGGSWYVVLGSSVAMLCSSFVNSHVNQFIGHLTDDGSFAKFALRSYVSTGVGQFVDNLVFALIVSYNFFGWTPVQVITCSITGALAELACEILLSPVGFRVASGWEREGVGEDYVQKHAAELEARA